MRPAAIFKCRTCHFHRRINIGFLATRHVGQFAAIQRADAIKGRAILRRHTCAIDKGAAIKARGFQGGGFFFPID